MPGVRASAHACSRKEMSRKACAVCSSPPGCPVSKYCGNAGPRRPAAQGGFSGTSQHVLSNQFSVRRAGGALEGTAQAPISSTQVPEAARDPTQGLWESPGFVQKDFAPDSVALTVTSLLHVFLPRISDSPPCKSHQALILLFIQVLFYFSVKFIMPYPTGLYLSVFWLKNHLFLRFLPPD